MWIRLTWHLLTKDMIMFLVSVQFDTQLGALVTLVWVTCPKSDPCPGFLGSQGEAGGLQLCTDLNKSNEVCTRSKQGNDT